MTLSDWLAQNFSGIFQGAVVAIIGILANRFFRRVTASQERTEEHITKLSNLDKVSVTANNRALEEWQRDMALRVEAVADGKSATLAWQAKNDQRATEQRTDLDTCLTELAAVRAELAACKRFMWELDAYAHGTGPVPIFSPDETFSTGQHALEGASHDQH